MNGLEEEGGSTMQVTHCLLLLKCHGPVAVVAVVVHNCIVLWKGIIPFIYVLLLSSD